MCGLKDMMKVFEIEVSRTKPGSLFANWTAGKTPNLREIREVVIETCAAGDHLKNDCPFPVRSVFKSIICAPCRSYSFYGLSFETGP